jgi:dethiobiotin synthetase
MSGYFIAGTDTGVGKTRVTCGLLAAYRKAGVAAGGMKPVAAGWTGSDADQMNEDVARIAAITGQNPHDRLLCPYSLREAASPHIGAAHAGILIQIERIRSCFDELRRSYPLLIVEGAGGWMAPLDKEHSMADVAVALELPVILVVGLRLGCLNHALLTAGAIARSGLPLAGWIANHIDPGFKDVDANVELLNHRLGTPPLAMLHFSPDAAAALPMLDQAARQLPHNR